MIDLIGYPLDLELVQMLLHMNQSSFPGFLNQIYVLGVNVLDHARDKETITVLAEPLLRKHVKFLGAQDYFEQLYANVRECTVLDHYRGTLFSEVVDLRPIVVESLIANDILL